MANRKRYFLADTKAVMPMPDRDGRAFPAGGATLDPAHPFYRQAIADGSLVEAPKEEPKAKPATEEAKADAKSDKSAQSKKG